MTIATSPTTSRQAIPGKYQNAAQWLHALGDIPPERIIMDPWPGTATEEDLRTFVERDKRLCELIDGTLVEKPVGFYESLVAGWILTILNNFVLPRGMGFVSGEAGMMRLFPGRVRLPDCAFVSTEQLNKQPQPLPNVPALFPDLAIEVLSDSNRPGEIGQKLKEYFDSGTRLAWVVDPQSRTVAVYVDAVTILKSLTTADRIDGGEVLPGFEVSVSEFFKPFPVIAR